MSKLELILLGQFECLLPSGTRISLSMRKAEVLLAYLALTPGLRHPRERLINLLWSDRSEEQARNSLRQCLSAIKKSLGDVADMVLQVDRTTVSLIPELIDIDVHEFERLAAEGDYESLTTAADLYQGEFLEGISIRDASCQEWLDSERGRFKRQFIELLSELAETQLLSHDFRNAIKSTERLVKQDPLGESGWRLLMRTYFDNGDRSHALQAFKRCQQALREELDVEPESATIELRDRIAAGEKKPPQAPTPGIGESSFDAPVTTAYSNEESSLAPQSSTDRSIAVLPFDNLSGDPEQEYFSDGITDSIILNLSLFPGLNVKSRNSSFAFKQQIKSIGEISKELNVDYIVEGSIRKADQRVRITVQLIEAQSGNQVWGKRYDSDIADLFDLEEDLSRTVAATVTGQIESDLERIAIAKGAMHQQSYDLLLAGSYYCKQFTGTDTVIAIEKLNRCLELDPDNLRAHAMLYYCHAMNWMERWIEDYEPAFVRAGEHAKKAILLGPESGIAQVTYAEYLIFRGEFAKSVLYLDKALEVNPNDPDALTTKALNLEAQGKFGEALKTAERAYQLDPYHPWADWALAESHYLCGQYENALEVIAKSRNAPGFIRLYNVASNIKLGREDDARQALQVYLDECRQGMLAMPKTLDEWTQYTIDNTPFEDSSINQDIIDCMLQAGLEEEMSTAQKSAEPEALPSILVLPFSNLSGDPEQEYFSDGITESIILNLGTVSGLKVKSIHASFAFKDSARSFDELATELGVQYIVEGSIRKFGDKVRITAQLADTASGNQVWGKRFDYDLEDLFALEEDLSLTIAGTVSGRVDKEAQLLAMRKPAKDMKSYDYVLRAFHHLSNFNAKDIRTGIELFEKCLALDPDNAEAHASLGSGYLVQLFENCAEDRTRTRELMQQHLERALELDPDNAQTNAFMAEALLYLKDFERGVSHARKAVKLNPTLPDGYAMMAQYSAANQQYDQAIQYTDQSIQIDPFHPYVGWNAGEIYRATENYERAIESFRALPHVPVSVHAQIAACLAGLGRIDEAREEMRQYLTLAREQMISIPAGEAEWYRFWDETMPYKNKEDTDRYFELLMQAGLCDHSEIALDSIPSIAVLPFENMSDDPEQGHFIDGITTDLIATLSKFRHLRTVSHYSTQQYKTEKPPLAEIAAQQQVRYILEGSVRKSGNRVRVSAELIDAHDESLCWSERYDHDLDDLFALQDQITHNIALAMKVQLDDGGMANLRSRGTTNIRAWELIMTAIDLQDTYIRQNILDSRAMADEAIQLDPDYAYAWLTLAWTHWQECYICGGKSIDAFIDAAEKANTRARNLDPDYAEVWSQAGLNYLMRHDAEAALESCRKAVELEPGSAEINALMAFACVFSGDYELALKYNQNIRKLCPVMANWYFLIEAQIEKIAGNFDKAAALYRQGLEIEPDSPLCRFYLVDVMMDKGDPVSAQAYADEIRALDNTVRGNGLVHSFSSDPDLRERFAANLAKFDLI